MKELEGVSLLQHHSRAVDALLVFALLCGLWVLALWALTPLQPEGVFSMQLIAQQTEPTGIYVYDSPTARDVAALRDASSLSVR